jgi:hypothetical protein
LTQRDVEEIVRTHIYEHEDRKPIMMRDFANGNVILSYEVTDDNTNLTHKVLCCSCLECDELHFEHIKSTKDNTTHEKYQRDKNSKGRK